MTEDLASNLAKLISKELKPSTILSHRKDLHRMIDLNRMLIALIIFWPEMDYKTPGEYISNSHIWTNKVLDL